MPATRCATIAILAVALLAVAGCASQGQFRYEAPQAAIEWPSPPDPPRYRFVGQLTGEDNFVRQPQAGSAVKKALAWVVGLVLGEGRPRVLQRPQGVYVDDDAQRIYVADMGRKAVFVFDQLEGRLAIWEQATRTGGFLAPIAIAPGGDGGILVTDAELGQVLRLSAQGEPLGAFGADDLERPTGLARDPASGRVYVADSRAHAVKIFDHQGRLVDTIGRRGEAEGQLNGPTHLALRQGRLHVVDTLNSRLQVFDAASGKFLRAFGKRGMYLGDMPRPKGVAVDSEGHVYVVESYYDYLLVYDAHGRPLLPIGGSGAGIGQFYLPAGVWIDSRDRVYVADMFNGRVVVFQYLGTGSPAQAPAADTALAPEVEHDNK